jgi:hypothetical protein
LKGTVNNVKISPSENGNVILSYDTPAPVDKKPRYRVGVVNSTGKVLQSIEGNRMWQMFFKLPSKDNLPDGKITVTVEKQEDKDSPWATLIDKEVCDLSSYLKPLKLSWSERIKENKKILVPAVAGVAIVALAVLGCASRLPGCKPDLATKTKQGGPTAKPSSGTNGPAAALTNATPGDVIPQDQQGSSLDMNPPSARPPTTPPAHLDTAPLTTFPVPPVATTNSEVTLTSTATTNRDIVRYIPVPVPYATNSGAASTNAAQVPGFVIDNHGTHGIVTYAGGQTIIANTVNIEAPQVPIAPSRRDSLYVPVNIGQKKVTIPAHKIARIQMNGEKVRPAHDLPPSVRWMIDGMTPQEAVNNPNPQEIKIYNDGADADIELKWGE